MQRAVRKGDWKLIRYPLVDVTQLFHLQDDPHELLNLADDPDYSMILSEMTTHVRHEQQCWSDPDPLEVADPMPAEVDVETFFRSPK